MASLQSLRLGRANSDRGALPQTCYLPRGLAGADRGDGRAGALLRRRGRRQEGAERHAESKMRKWLQQLLAHSLLKGSLDDRIFLHDVMGVYVAKQHSAAGLTSMQRGVVDTVLVCCTTRRAGSTRARCGRRRPPTMRSTGTSAATSASTWSLPTAAAPPSRYPSIRIILLSEDGEAVSADTNSAYDRWGGHVKQVGLKGGTVIRVHADGAAVDVLLDDGSVMEACPKKRLRAGPTGAEAVEATELSWLRTRIRRCGSPRCARSARSAASRLRCPWWRRASSSGGTTILRRAAATALIAFGEFTEAQSYGFITQVTELLTSPPEELLGTYALARERFEWARLLLPLACGVGGARRGGWRRRWRARTRSGRRSRSTSRRIHSRGSWRRCRARGGGSTSIWGCTAGRRPTPPRSNGRRRLWSRRTSCRTAAEWEDIPFRMGKIGSVTFPITMAADARLLPLLDQSVVFGEDGADVWSALELYDFKMMKQVHSESRRRRPLPRLRRRRRPAAVAWGRAHRAALVGDHARAPLRPLRRRARLGRLRRELRRVDARGAAPDPLRPTGARRGAARRAAALPYGSEASVAHADALWRRLEQTVVWGEVTQGDADGGGAGGGSEPAAEPGL